MKKFAKNFPIETYVLLMPALVFLFVIGVYMFFRGPGYVEYFFHGHFLSSIIPVDITFVAIFLIVIINIIEVLLMYKNRVDNSQIVRFIRSSLFVLAVFYFSLQAIFISVQLIFNIADPIRTVISSTMFTNWDYAIFGTYPWLSFHSFITIPWMQNFIYVSYLKTLFVVFILLLILTFKNLFLFRKFFLAYLIAMIIGIPFWIIFPALAPDIMYRANILNVPVQPELKEKIDNTYFSPKTEEVLLSIRKLWIDEKKESLPVTTFPSMHAAWGIIVAVIGIELWAPFAIILVPWVLAELVGTIFTLEHYAVDTIFGIILGFLALYIASRLLKLDKEKSFDRWDLFMSIRHAQKDFKNFLLWIKKKTKSFLRLK